MKTTAGQTMFRFPIVALTTSMMSIFLVDGTAHANEDYDLTCTINKYDIGQGYSEKIMLSYIPNKMNIEYRDGRTVQVHFPSTDRRLRGEIFRENEQKFSFRMSARSVAKEGMTYTVDYFKKSRKIFIDTDFGAGYAPLGDASGVCEDLAPSSASKPSRLPYPSQPATVSRSKPGVFVPPSKQTDDLAGWDERSVALKWDGVSDLLAGKIYIKRGERSGRMEVDLPRGEGKCSGTYRMGSPEGTWAVACPDGITASGTYKGFGSGKGAEGEGVDSEGRNVRFTISAR